MRDSELFKGSNAVRDSELFKGSNAVRNSELFKGSKHLPLLLKVLVSHLLEAFFVT